jgi:hypothetical protein
MAATHNEQSHVVAWRTSLAETGDILQNTVSRGFHRVVTMIPKCANQAVWNLAPVGPQGFLYAANIQDGTISAFTAGVNTLSRGRVIAAKSGHNFVRSRLAGLRHRQPRTSISVPPEAGALGAPLN